MKKFFYKWRKTVVSLLKLAMYVSLMGIFFLLMSIHNPQVFIPSRTMAVTMLTFIVMGVLITSIYGRYDIGIRKSRPITYSISITMILTDIVTFVMLIIMNTNEANSTKRIGEDVCLLLIVIFLQAIIILIFVYGGNAIYFGLVPPERSLIITDSMKTLGSLYKGLGKYKKQYEITKVMMFYDEDIWKEILNVDAIFLNNLPNNLKTEVIEYCYKHLKNVYYNPEIADVVNINSKHVLLDDVSMIHSNVKDLTAGQKFTKRMLDVVVSIIGLTIASPVMLVCAAAIKAGDGGPILFRQNRVTLGGRIFTIYKFRTMIVNADKHLVTDHDTRITKAGRVLRKYRLDELPQLINILKGDMSLVGPRPEMTQYVYVYSENLPEFQYRHRVKAGLTGYAQIMGKYNTSSKDKLIMDLMYIENFSIKNDIKIVLQTILVLFKASDSTEAFSETDDRHEQEDKVHR